MVFSTSDFILDVLLLSKVRNLGISALFLFIWPRFALFLFIWARFCASGWLNQSEAQNLCQKKRKRVNLGQMKGKRMNL